jgi:phosphoglycerate kinase
MAKVTLRDLKLRDQRVLVRVDFNVPLEDRDGKRVITDDTRIRETLPTIDYLHAQGAKVILMSHLGRPKGKKNPAESLRPVAEHLSELLVRPVAFVDDCIGEKVEKTAGLLQPGDTLLLENVRFYPEEEKNDPAFAKKLASLGDIYVNDAFGAAHRAHASTEGVARYVKQSAIGLLMEKELKFLQDQLQSPKKPFLVILGGAKVSDKIGVIEALLNKADVILVGGAMAYTFALAQGQKIGNSLTEPDKLDIARQALEKAKAKNVKLLLPTDHVIVEKVDFKNRTISTGKLTKPGEPIPDGWQGVDIGPETIKAYQNEIAKSHTILWNGPMGIFEIKECAKGTFAIAEAIAANREALSIVGGGDSVKAVHQSGCADKVTFISTGGGASLELLEGKTLPGVAVIPDKS